MNETILLSAKKRSSGSFLNVIYEMGFKFIYLIYNKSLALNNLQRLICHKTKPNQTYL